MIEKKIAIYEEIIKDLKHAIWQNRDTITRAKRCDERLGAILPKLEFALNELNKELAAIEAEAQRQAELIESIPIGDEPPFVNEFGHDQYVLPFASESTHRDKDLADLKAKPVYRRVLQQLATMCGFKWENRSRRIYAANGTESVEIFASKAMTSKVFSYHRDYLEDLIEAGSPVASKSTRHERVVFVLYPDQIQKELSV